MNDRRSEQGQGRVGLIVAVAIVSIGIFVAMRVIPVKVAAYEFRDAIRQEVRLGAVREDNATVKKRLLEIADELEIPLSPKNLQIRRTRSELVIKARYVQPIDLKVTVYDYQFLAEERAPLF